MTVGELPRRTGLSSKAIREYEALGLIYSAGRSESNYRLFDNAALWCAGVIERLRALGLTIKEIRELARVYEQSHERWNPNSIGCSSVRSVARVPRSASYASR